MNHIFISYSRADKEKAELLAKIINSKGWEVWWDRKIPPGRQFDDVIEEALKTANCVVVLWSKSSVSSRWVKTEAAEGASRDILVPILLEEVEIPLAFRRIQTANLVNWNGEAENDQFIQIINSIREIVGSNFLSHSTSAKLESQVISKDNGIIDNVKLKVFLKGEWQTLDVKFDVYLDGILLGKGSYKKGIDLSASTNIGKHVLELRSKYIFLLRPIRYKFNLTSRGEYTIQVKYRQSGRWGDPPGWKFYLSDGIEK